MPAASPPSPPADLTSTPAHLDLDVSRSMGAVTVTARGLLNVSTARVLHAVLRDLIEGQGNRVAVDLHDITLGDSASLDGLVGSAVAAGRLGGQLTFTNPSDTVAAALEAAGLSIGTSRSRVGASATPLAATFGPGR